MENRKPEPRSIGNGHSFSNGNGPQVITLPLEGHVIGDVHWWWFG